MAAPSTGAATARLELNGLCLESTAARPHFDLTSGTSFIAPRGGALLTEARNTFDLGVLELSKNRVILVREHARLLPSWTSLGVGHVG